MNKNLSTNLAYPLLWAELCTPPTSKFTCGSQNPHYLRNVAVFVNTVFKEVIMLNGVIYSGPWSSMICVLIRRGNQETHTQREDHVKTQ